MNANFYRVWIPASVLAHLALLLLVRWQPALDVPTPLEVLTEIAILPAAAEPTPVPPDLTPRPAPPTPRAPTTSPDDTPGVAHPRVAHGTGTTEPKDTQPGPGKHPTAPPDVMRTPTSTHWPAPPGREGGTGTSGTDLGPSGPTSPPAALGGPVRGTDKALAESEADGIVTLAVDIDATGKIGTIRVASNTGDTDLAAAAIAKVQRRGSELRLVAALQKGTPVAGVLRIRVTVHNGEYVLEGLKP